MADDPNQIGQDRAFVAQQQEHEVRYLKAKLQEEFPGAFSSKIEESIERAFQEAGSDRRRGTIEGLARKLLEQ